LQALFFEKAPETENALLHAPLRVGPTENKPPFIFASPGQKIRVLLSRDGFLPHWISSILFLSRRSEMPPPDNFFADFGDDNRLIFEKRNGIWREWFQTSPVGSQSEGSLI
jgi:hypothetical protein